jgi:hypothetical protein
MKATIKKATPAQSQLLVSTQTTMAIMVAGRKKRIALTMTTIIMRPMTKRISKTMISNSKGKPGREKNAIGKFLQTYLLNSLRYLSF